MKSNTLFVINIKGGFGNQLFQYNFANFLRDLGYKVKVDNSFFYTAVNDLDVTYRKEIINSKLFNFTNINRYEKYLIAKLTQLGNKKRFQFFSSFYENKIFKNVKEKDFSVGISYPKIIYCDGYWQDLNFVSDDFNFIKSSLMKIDVINDALMKEIEQNSFMLIIRRGDYIKMEQDLKLDYYKKCLEISRSITNSPIINIFTDDIQWVKSQEIFNDVNCITGPEEDPENVLKLFSNMIQNQHYFVGNSTLSFFAALIGKKHNSKIYVAEPWFRNRETKNLLHPEWIRIKNN